MQEGAVLEMRGICKYFPGVRALQDVDFTPAGRGDSRPDGGERRRQVYSDEYAFRHVRADEGEIIIRGEKVKIQSPNHATKLNIGMVHQHFKLVSNYTIAENIIMGMEPVKKTLGLFSLCGSEEGQ